MIIRFLQAAPSTFHNLQPNALNFMLAVFPLETPTQRAKTTHLKALYWLNLHLMIILSDCQKFQTFTVKFHLLRVTYRNLSRRYQQSEKGNWLRSNKSRSFIRSKCYPMNWKRRRAVIKVKIAYQNLHQRKRIFK